MCFGKAFATRKEAKAHLDKIDPSGNKQKSQRLTIRKMSKKIFPRRKKLFHVGDEMDFLNFA
jgi:hypothetical protein